jgi:hypothetical protein
MWHILWPKVSSWDSDLTLNLSLVCQAWYTAIYSYLELKVVSTSILYSQCTWLYQSNPTGHHWLKFFTVFIIFLWRLMRQSIIASCDHFLSYWLQLSFLLSFHTVYSLCLIYLALVTVRTVILCSIQMNMFIVITKLVLRSTPFKTDLLDLPWQETCGFLQCLYVMLGEYFKLYRDHSFDNFFCFIVYCFCHLVLSK